LEVFWRRGVPHRPWPLRADWAPGLVAWRPFVRRL